jgi:hypothetical protein
VRPCPQVKPLALHLTWTSLSREGKVHRLREAGLWADPPEYYSQAGQLLTVDMPKLPAPPADLAPEFRGPIDEQKLTQFHLDVMELQLRQVGGRRGGGAGGADGWSRLFYPVYSACCPCGQRFRDLAA